MHENNLQSWAIFRREPFSINSCQLWDLLYTDPPENESRFQMSKWEVYSNASNNRIPYLQRDLYIENWPIEQENNFS